jgi:hypothetical protein
MRKLGIGCAVALVALLGACATGSPPAAEPSVGSAYERIPKSGPLEAGTHILVAESPALDPILVTVQLPDHWAGRDGWVLTTGGGVDDEEGAAIQFWGAPDYTYRDACHWSTTQFPVEKTVDFMASALAAQQPRNASTPREISVGGRRAIEIQLSVPDDIVLSTCDQYKGDGAFQSWHYGSGQSGRYHQGPGQRDLIRLIDVDGRVVIIDAATWPQLPEETRAEMLAVLDSISIDLPSE